MPILLNYNRGGNTVVQKSLHLEMTPSLDIGQKDRIENVSIIF